MLGVGDRIYPLPKKKVDWLTRPKKSPFARGVIEDHPLVNLTAQTVIVVSKYSVICHYKKHVHPDGVIASSVLTLQGRYELFFLPERPPT